MDAGGAAGRGAGAPLPRRPRSAPRLLLGGRRLLYQRRRGGGGAGGRGLARRHVHAAVDAAGGAVRPPRCKVHGALGAARAALPRGGGARRRRFRAASDARAEAAARGARRRGRVPPVRRRCRRRWRRRRQRGTPLPHSHPRGPEGGKLAAARGRRRRLHRLPVDRLGIGGDGRRAPRLRRIRSRRARAGGRAARPLPRVAPRGGRRVWRRALAALARAVPGAVRGGHPRHGPHRARLPVVARRL
mmetsp:Transcript_10693/g.34299  ORF Transcript_10693/g.34299 Transcript_10693/m.34299 type:complete len:245 (-) Transcript_10693:290-1024(-)